MKMHNPSENKMTCQVYYLNENMESEAQKMLNDQTAVTTIQLVKRNRESVKYIVTVYY